jgi:CRISPR/Cas system CSM-associated protein Csm2 small subunit
MSTSAEFYDGEILSYYALVDFPSNIARKIDKRITNTQLRSFYQEARQAWNSMNIPGADEKRRNELYMQYRHMPLLLLARVKYNNKRDPKKCPLDFVDFVEGTIKNTLRNEQISKPGFEKMRDFILVFEAMVGYTHGTKN